MPLVVTVSGSPAPSSRTRSLAGWAGQWLAARQIDVTAVDVRELPPDEVFFGQTRSPAVRQALDAVEAADGVVIVTPIYKASFSGLLKVFLDLLPQTGLTDKVVLPLAVGGAQSHVLAIDYALRPVLSALNALHVTTGLFFLDEQLQRTPEGALQIVPGAQERLQQVLASFAGSLHVHSNARRAAASDAPVLSTASAGAPT